MRRWLKLGEAHAPDVPVEVDAAARRGLIIELVIVALLTFGMSGISAALTLIESALSSGGVAGQTVALNPSRSDFPVIDALRQLLSVVRLVTIGGLGAYLLWRGGLSLRRLGFGKLRWRRDVASGAGLGLLIGVPGLAVVAVAAALGLNSTIEAASTDGPWWRIPVLVLTAVGNALAEEIVVVAYFLVRLRQLGVSPPAALAASAVLRGSYHLYQGFGGGIGNLAMGLVFARWYQVTGRIWPLVIAHAGIDIVAFVGYALASDHLGWLTG